ncbi:MAG: hypothetical protein UY48_C0018G0013 [Candidatus Gottesmanbacteria bacterium GW2011_GWB1_49_7]|uniref:Uncharacterized protein n=1 Tax=Candidatus Gottesmanbacteria bacterium GW2011_GWB1_49_7 TaxID=1618448 RepID=A0A0G1YYN7_9BACT|nr:MAG: hypothetical protein UY48_C0018G0013 [Candidatus Gottesmanbacteria bacterium GW2011_GWB1_49_7]
MQHYQRNTRGILKYCPTCNRMTMHQVDDRRVGSCRETHVVGMSKAQAKMASLKDKAKAYSLF